MGDIGLVSIGTEQSSSKYESLCYRYQYFAVAVTGTGISALINELTADSTGVITITGIFLNKRLSRIFASASLVKRA